ncbi:MAG: ribosome small subunit-dependent GTPase A [Clostridium sp.]
MKKYDLKKIGLEERIIGEASFYGEDLYIGRVSVEHKGKYRVITESSEVLAEVSGKFAYEAMGTHSFPTVGDWVLLDRDSDKGGNAIIHHLLRRKSSFERKVAGNRHDIQVVASNVDTVFLTMALNNDFNVRRLERYLGVAYDSLSNPVILLTKRDLCTDLNEKLNMVNEVAIGVPVIVSSSVDDIGVEEIKKYTDGNKTIAFIGSSGVGKSTLVNKLIGEEMLETGGLRNDDKGRHTTTFRQLILLSSGGAIIDTPGMRELQISSIDMESSFSDIEELATMCRFSDCSHESEPRCAVRSAIEEGTLSVERLQSYKKLKREESYQNKSSQSLEKEKINNMFGSFSNMKKMRKEVKNKNKNR